MGSSADWKSMPLKERREHFRRKGLLNLEEAAGWFDWKKQALYNRMNRAKRLGDKFLAPDGTQGPDRQWTFDARELERWERENSKKAWA